MLITEFEIMRLTTVLKEIEEPLDKSPLNAYKRLIPLFREYPSNIKVLTLLSHVNVLLENYKSGKFYAEKVVMLDSTNIKARYIIGFCHLSLKEFRDAVKVYTRIIEAEPASAVAHLFLGIALTTCSDKDKTIEAYCKAAALDKAGDVSPLAEEAVLKLKGAS